MMRSDLNVCSVMVHLMMLCVQQQQKQIPFKVYSLYYTAACTALSKKSGTPLKYSVWTGRL